MSPLFQPVLPVSLPEPRQQRLREWISSEAARDFIAVLRGKLAHLTVGNAEIAYRDANALLGDPTRAITHEQVGLSVRAARIVIALEVMEELARADNSEWTIVPTLTVNPF